MTDYIEIHHTLPCGHVLQHRCIHWPPKMAWEMLNYWLQHRVENHVCEYVTPENPTGNKRKHARK